jgi:gliding motility-associated-like protein
MKYFLPAVLLLISYSVFSQSQVCPLNNSFSQGNLTHWEAYTGNNAGGNGESAIKLKYDSATGAPSGTVGNNIIYEYGLPSVPGIQVLSLPATDAYGGFSTIPTINGFKYTNSILLGSTSISRSASGGSQGGYVRGVSYKISVPPGSTTVPYTMTYAYAMVLENGTHNSDQQPLFSATLIAGGKVISCASPQYFLPTRNNAQDRGVGAILDTALAKSQGFYLSGRVSPNPNPNSPNPNAVHLRDVWAKNWTEVTFDLSPYRGQQVTLTFETDNCVPGGHFAYSYVALRNVCAGLQISGFPDACVGSTLTYSIPALTGASYQWSVPGDWTIVEGTDSSVLQVKIGSDAGAVVAHETNSCANLQATLAVTTRPPTIAGAVSGGSEVCAGSNTNELVLTGNKGSILNWQASTDGVNWTAITNTTPTLTAQDLLTTTSYRAVVQNGASCDVDTSSASTVPVDPQTVGGQLTPSSQEFCIGQNKDALLTLTGAVGKPVDWQSSPDALTWTDFSPVYTETQYQLAGITAPTQYRVVVKSGVCPPENSAPANIDIVNTPFPQATYDPADTLICYNTSASLNATITVGTDYAWMNTGPLADQGNGTISSLPYSTGATATPLTTTDYILHIENAGCPNLLKDTFHIRVYQPIIVDAGNDTAVVINQPLQLHASSNDTASAGDTFNWTPIIGLNDPDIADPIGTYNAETDSIRYIVKATSIPYGCTGYGQVLVRVFKTGPDIFVPNAFTPGGGTNNIFRPIAVGIQSLQYFRVYNRWGQLMYTTSRLETGWDGRYNGRMMEPGAYVWMVQGISYMGKIVFHKGTMVLVR